MHPQVTVTSHVSGFAASSLAKFAALTPWALAAQSAFVVRELLASAPTAEFGISDEIAIHRTAVVEPGAVIKGALILGASCFVAAGAYLRGGNWIADNCTFGRGAELKSSFAFPGTTLAHFNFMGDSVLKRTELLDQELPWQDER